MKKLFYTFLIAAFACVSATNAQTATVTIAIQLLNTNGDSVQVTFLTDNAPNGVQTVVTGGSGTFQTDVNNINNGIVAFFYDCNGQIQLDSLFINPGTALMNFTADYCPNSSGVTTLFLQLANAGNATIPVTITTDSFATGMTVNAVGGYFNGSIGPVSSGGAIGISFTDCNGVVQDTVIYANASTVYFNDDYCPQSNTNPCGTMFYASYSASTNTFTLMMDSGLQVFTGQFTWSFGDGSSSTDPFPSHSYQNSGVYEVCLTYYTPNGVSCTYCHNIGIDSLGNVVLRLDEAGFNVVVVPFGSLGVNDLPESDIDIYPNPVTENTSISLYASNAAQYDITIFNAAGQQVKALNINATAGQNNVRLPLSDLAKGMYLMTIQFDGKTVSRSFVK